MPTENGETMTDEPDKVDLSTPDLAAENRDALAALFPGVLADGVLDSAKLGELLDTPVAQVPDGRERYGLQWAGKQEAIRSLLTPSRGTLAPDLERSIDFDTAQNVFIEGDNLEVLKLLQKSYNDKIKLIYIDPPYNTGNDFVYNDDFSDGLRGYLEYTGQLDEDGNRAAATAETAGRRHSRWLSMMYPRLVLARNLLHQRGAILISIDDTELASLILLLKEIFGAENFVSSLVHQRAKGGGQAKYVVKGHDYVLCFARNLAEMPPLLRPKVIQQQVVTIEGIDYIKNDDVVRRSFGKYDKSEDRRCFYEELEDLKGLDKKLEVDALVAEGKLFLEPFRDTGRTVIYELTPVTEAASKVYSIIKALSEEGKKDLEELGLGGAFDYPKSVNFMSQIVEAVCLSDRDAVVLDFFSGSGSTAHAVALRNAADEGRRRCISVNLPEPTDEDSEARKLGYETVSAVTHARLKKVTETVEGAGEMGLRTFVLNSSNFDDSEVEEGELDLRVSTLASQSPDWESVAAEALLKEGVTLDEKWERRSISGAYVVVAGGVAVVLSTQVNDDLVAGALDLKTRVVIFLEDGFAGADAVKANAFTNAKNLGITMKTI